MPGSAGPLRQAPRPPTWVFPHGCTRAVRRSSLGKLVRQLVELPVCVVKPSVEQGEPFNEQAHMRGGSPDGVWCYELDRQRPQPVTQRPSIDALYAVLLQHLGRFVAGSTDRFRWTTWPTVAESMHGLLEYLRESEAA